MKDLEHPCTGPAGPSWHKDNGELHCLSCGAQQHKNPETGNMVWIRNGRVIAAVQDLNEAKQRHDERWR